MDNTGPPPTSGSNPSNPTSPDESFADFNLPSSTDSPSNNGAFNHNTTSPQPHSHPAFPGAQVYTPTATPSDRLNPRSCVTCRRRKVRCDKHMPCSNCRRAQIPCIFPAPGRAPRRPRPKDPNAPPKQPSSEREIELMKRLRKLEGIVEELSGQIEVETARNHSSSGNSPETTAANAATDFHTPGSGPRLERADSMTAGSTHSQGSPSGPGDGRMAAPYNFNSSAGTPAARHDNVNKKFGRLVINDHGKTRYVSSAFWSKITDELDELRHETQKLTDEESSDSDDESIIATANNRSGGDHHAFVLGYRSADVDLRSLHPLPSQIPYMWQVYQENVDPIVKVLHVPTVENLVKETRKNLDSLTPGNEALMFAIYFAAITSMDEEDTKKNFGVDRPRLISQYRFALEQSLAKAEFLVSSEMVVLQAFILFLVLVRRHDDTRVSWTLTGLAVRMGQSMGLHRDGTSFPGLTPLEIEMRRRLFWALCILDLRAAEDQGTDLTIIDRTFDTEFPLNINDADITPEMTEMPQPRQGSTDMTFSLIRYEICGLARRLHTMSSANAGSCPRDAAISFEERENMVREVYASVEGKFFLGPDASQDPILWTAANIARVIVAKMTLVIYQPMLFPGPEGETLSSEIRDRIFTAATEIFEYNHQLNSDPRSRPWRWLFQTYTAWHAVAYVLMEVVRRPWSAAVERAWAALNATFASPNPEDLNRIAGDQSVWLPLKKIYLKAKKHREGEISRLKADPSAAQELELQERRSAGAPASFAAMPGSVKTAVANERWRKLVNAPRLPPELEKQNTPFAPFLQQQQPQQSQQKPSGQQGDSVPPSQVPTSMGIGGGLPGQNVGDERAMEIVENVMNQPHFQPDSFWPIAFSPQYADIARAATNNVGFPFSDPIPRQDPTLANFANGNGDAASNRTVPGTSMSTDPRMQQTPLVDALKVEGNLPPWLWSDAPVATTAAQTFGGTPGSVTTASSGGGGPMSASTPARAFSFPLPAGNTDVQPEDIDVNMDEDFNWADWGQSLMESTGANMGGVWSAHGM
ncbi:all development altered-3 [Diaporthe amygdali]|uniref:all development altered-3 n=1 Tax=Phomopsis amygdali TaxID=1214568 RepID=UPI0022FE063C|nr:all development altered-3 [Diaporthe amygdali]KAJ0122613.1 all development altered-3 [Diaporthe amygdali]